MSSLDYVGSSQQTIIENDAKHYLPVKNPQHNSKSYSFALSQ